MATQSSTTLYNKFRETGFRDRTARIHARHLLPYIERNHRILDIGCGPGSITADLAELVPAGEVLGIDHNSGDGEDNKKHVPQGHRLILCRTDSIQAAISLTKARGLTNLSFRVADVKQELVGIESGSFDIVHAHQVLLHLPDPRGTLREARRLLKPGGLLSTVDSAVHAIVPALPGVISSNTAYERLSRNRGADPNFGQRHHIVANEAGFDWGDIEISSWGMGELNEKMKARMVEGAALTANMFIIEGLIGEDEAREQQRDSEEWGSLPEARWRWSLSVR